MIVPTFVGLDPGPAKFKNRRGTIATLDSWADVLGLPYYGFFNVRSSPGSPVDWIWVATATLQSPIHISLGKEASKVLTKIKVPHFQLPHPSGLNRKLNDKTYLAEVLVHCRQYINSQQEK